MKISKRDSMLLLALAGLLIFLLLYLLVFNTFQAKADAAAQNVATLTPQLQQLEQEYQNLATYQSEIEQYRSSSADKLAAFPADIKEEDLMSYLMTLEADNGITLDSISFNGSTMLTEFPGMVQKDGKDVATTMDAYSSNVVTTGQFSYDQMKKVIDYIYSSPRQTSLNSVAVSYNSETGGLTGSLDINRYYISYPEAVYTPEPLPSVALGVTDPFGTVKTTTVKAA